MPPGGHIRPKPYVPWTLGQWAVAVVPGAVDGVEQLLSSLERALRVIPAVLPGTDEGRFHVTLASALVHLCDNTL